MGWEKYKNRVPVIMKLVTKRAWSPIFYLSVNNKNSKINSILTKCHWLLGTVGETKIPGKDIRGIAYTVKQRG